MGVRGWNRLLANKGWIPCFDSNNSSSSDSAKTSLWMDLEYLQDNDTLAERLVTIPAGSEFHVDGVALCFHIHSVAYARYRSTFFAIPRRKQYGRKIKQKPIAPWQVRQALPLFLPLSYIDSVAQEFVQELQGRHEMKLVVYWDGDQRYSLENNDDEDDSHGAAFKHQEELRRQGNRADEWSNLQQYCLHGRVPLEAESDWEQAFSKNRLFITQVMHTLMTNSSCKMIFSEEEADSIMAEAVTGRPDAYIVGTDSDFCFFANVNYIPLNNLWITNNLDRTTNRPSCQAVVLRREVLAESFGFSEDNCMVDVAILMGNDYVDANILAQLDLPAKIAQNVLDDRKKKRNSCVDSILDYVRNANGPVTASQNSEAQMRLDFVRKLYSLEDMSEYPLQDALASEDPTMIPAVDPTLIDINFLVSTSEESKETVQDAVVRYLMTILDEQAGKEDSFMDMMHVEAFQNVSMYASCNDINYSDLDKNMRDKYWRPLWSDIAAVYWIERVTSMVIQNTLRQAVDRGVTKEMANIVSPSRIFSSYLFHSILLKTREGLNDNGNAADNDGGGSSNPSTCSAGVGEVTNEIDAKKVLLPKAAEEAERLRLPVDKFEEMIVSSVQKNRVTIIQGETGCGKSSRIPVMLLKAPPPNPNHQTTKLFVSVPRRIAAKALVERLRDVEPEIKDQIALRMGHGVREYESKETRAWFVTSGYLVRLMANHPDHFDKISILTIDEVHERSVDTDILCLLCRRLLVTNSHLRLVLMSATLAAALYQNYFGVPEPPIKVGARRFPVREVYLDTLASEVALAAGDAKRVNSLLMECSKLKGARSPSAQYLEKAHAIVANLATSLGEPGSSVLIFVPGMTDIVAITEHIEGIHVPGIHFETIPVHSDIPFEDQMHVFDSANSNTVKIILGTNACESSVTLPDVDHVICLGLCKQIVYNEASHRQMLVPTWISRASATQRAGRTGRVRPGTVYRIYSRETYENYMDAFEPGEMLRIPLDSVILMLKEMLPEDAVTEILQTCLEPPNLSTIERSFTSLFSSHFITSPDDSCSITTLGAFVSALGIDLALGFLIGLGIQMGVGAEAIQIAAVLSFPKTPWIVSNALIHPTKDFNEQTRKTFVSRCHFDSNLFSEPLAVMNLLHDYKHTPRNKENAWCRSYGVFQPRLKRLQSTAENLRKRVADFVGINEALLVVNCPPRNMPHGKVTILRIIQVWVFHETVIQLDPKKFQKKTSEMGTRIALQPKSDQIESEDLEQILLKERHPYTLEGSSEVVQKGSFEYSSTGNTSSLGDEFLKRLEAHLISYATEKGIDGAWISFSDSLSIFYRVGSPLEIDMLSTVMGAVNFEETTMFATPFEGKARRGIGERACGACDISVGTATESGTNQVTWLRFRTSGKIKQNKMKDITKDLARTAKEYLGKLCSFYFPWAITLLQANKMVKFEASSFGSTKSIATIDLRDLLGPALQSSPPKKHLGTQALFFSTTKPNPLLDKGSTTPNEFNRDKADSSWARPLMDCAPEGARLLAVLASLCRNDKIKLLTSTKNNSGEKGDEDLEENEILEIFLEKGNNITFRWKRFDSTDTVLTDANSVPASAVPATRDAIMYCVCANTLELRNGGLRADGLTLLPPGREFLLLSRLSFGLFDDHTAGSITKDSIEWAQCSKKRKDMLSKRVQKAVEFHQSSIELGEGLECFPEKVQELLSIFDGIDGYESKPWETLHENAFISRHLQNHKKELEERKTARSIQRESSTMDDRRETSDQKNNSRKASSSSKSSRSKQIIMRQSNITSALSELEGQEIIRVLNKKSNGKELRSAPVLGVVVKETRCRVADTNERDYQHALTDWVVANLDEGSKVWYQAIFKPSDLLYVQRTSHNLASWMRQEDPAQARPTTIDEAKCCIPASFEGVLRNHMLGTGNGLFFDSVALAVQMEAAFWLERQFATKKKHWYDQDLANGSMSDRLIQEFKAAITRRNRQKANKNKKVKKVGKTKLNKESKVKEGNGS